jgi:chromate transporter
VLPWTARLLDAVNAAALGLMAAVAVELGRAALVDVVTVVIALISSIALVQFKVNATWLLMASAFVGFLARG